MKFLGFYRLWLVLLLISGVAMVVVVMTSWSELVYGPIRFADALSCKLSLIGGLLGVLVASSVILGRLTEIYNNEDAAPHAVWANTISVALLPVTVFIAYSIHAFCVVSIFNGWPGPLGNIQVAGFFSGMISSIFIAVGIMLPLQIIAKTACWIAEGFLS